MRNSAAIGLAAALAAFGGPAVGSAAAQSIEDLGSVAPFLDHCVTRGLRGQGFSAKRDVTLRMSFRRDGSIIATPAVTYSQPSRGDAEQERFIGAISKAIADCTPLPFSKGLGAAIAGRIFTFRYTLTDAKDTSI